MKKMKTDKKTLTIAVRAWDALCSMDKNSIAYRNLEMTYNTYANIAKRIDNCKCADKLARLMVKLEKAVLHMSLATPANS